MRAEIIAIGSELTSGQSLDTNSQWLSQQLAALGVTVAFHTTLSDVLEDHLTAFRIACERADLVVMSGGLGPTQDDLTREALAEVTGVPLVEDADSLAAIAAMFARRNRVMSERNRVQALFPRGAEPLVNPVGTVQAGDLDADRSGDRRMPARRTTRNETDVSRAGRKAPAASEWVGERDHRFSQDQHVRQGGIRDRGPGDGPDGPGARAGGRDHRVRRDHQLPDQRPGADSSSGSGVLY